MQPTALKPLWSSATFLQYLGTAFVLGSLAWLLGVFEDDQGTGGLLGWSALALVVTGGVAIVAQRRGEAIVAGLLAVVAVVMWSVFVGAFFDLIGLLDDVDSDTFFHEGLALDWIVFELLIVTACAVALATFRFPLIVVLLAVTIWYAVLDLLEGLLGGGDWATAFLSLLVGFLFVSVGLALDGGGHNPYAFWWHVAGGLSIGGAVLWWWHEETWEWLLVMLVALGYIAVARALGRSSYAVFGAIGLIGTATYFIEKWFSLSSLVPFFEAEPEDVTEWGRPLVYLALGAVLVVLGLLVERRRAALPPHAEPPPV